MPTPTKRSGTHRVTEEDPHLVLNQIWALDADSLYSGRAFRTLNLIDEGNRQVLGIEVAHSIPSLWVIRVMEQLIELHGWPTVLRLDNGPELTAIAFTDGIDCRRRNSLGPLRSRASALDETLEAEH